MIAAHPRRARPAGATVELSNWLTELAARIKAEHEATAATMKRSVEHAMAAGDLLIEAKARLSHGQWLPWLTEHCAISERSAQLYMRIAKNRQAIEARNAQHVADLTLNQAAALLVMTSDMKRLLDFTAQLENVNDPEAFLKICLDNGVGAIVDHSYDPFAARTEEEKREWNLFCLFLVRHCGGAPDGVEQHVEWLLQRPFQNVAEWIGPEGDKCRLAWQWKTLPPKLKEAWSRFAADHASRSIEDIAAELNSQPKDLVCRRRAT
jgi:Protein of unknown function (DUF3102)